ncbi:MAG: iron-sulfur cluster assembly accessory protein [Acidobacteriota bacterium]
MSDPLISVSEAAKAKILELLAAEEQKDLALRVEIAGRGPGGFQYDLQFVGLSEKADSDRDLDAGGFRIFVDGETAADIAGARIEWVEGPLQSGFKVENPNPLWSDPTAVAVQEVIEKKINPGIASHGGFITLLDVKDDTAYISLGGGCQGCGMADVTLKQGIEVMIKEAVPAIRNIIDTTDHAGGTNPYYQPGKGGEPPLS